VRPLCPVTGRPLSPPAAGGILVAGGLRHGYGAVMQQAITTRALPARLAAANALQRKGLALRQGHSIVLVAPDFWEAKATAARMAQRQFQPYPFHPGDHEDDDGEEDETRAKEN